MTVDAGFDASIKAVAIGGSAGSVQALSRILPSLPAGFALPVFVVVHVPPDRGNALVPLFAAKCQVEVKEAEDKEPARAGVVYFAPSDYHLLVEADGSLSLSSDELVNHSRPSIDVLFESCADAYGPALAGVILTGANHDGAAGLGAVVNAGGVAIVEDPDGAYAPAMPDRGPRRLTIGVDDDTGDDRILPVEPEGGMTGADEPINFLLVDDLEENLLALEALLQRDGLACLKARSGEEALELLLVHDFALALLDVQMPGMDGFQLAEFMRGAERVRHVPIIFITAGAADTQRRFRGYEAGAVDFIQKPIETDILRHKANVFFDLNQQRRQIVAQRDALEAYAHTLRIADRNKNQFLAVLGHELRNPVMALTAGLNILARRDDPDKALTIRAQMERQVQHLSRLIEDLLDISRIDQGKISLKKETIALQTVVEFAVEASRPQVEGKQHTLTLDIPAEPTWLDADPTRLTQVISNLIDNAAKYTPAGGQIRLAAHNRRRLRGHRRRRQRHRHSQRRAAQDIRTLRAGDQSQRQGAGGAGDRAGAGQAAGRAAWGDHFGDERGAEPGEYVSGAAAGGGVELRTGAEPARANTVLATFTPFIFAPFELDWAAMTAFSISPIE